MIKCYTDIRFTKGVDDMYRSAIEKLKKWKDSYFRKPLIIEGARQVGKTWLMKEFGKECYKKTGENYHGAGNLFRYNDYTR